MEEMSYLHEHGVFLRRDALDAGYDDKALYSALRGGSIARVRYGAYVSAGTWQRSNHAQRHALQAHAVALTHQPPFAVSHVSGTILHGAEIWGAGLDTIHLTRPLPANGQSSKRVRYHLGEVDNRVTIRGTPTLGVADCLVGAAMVSSTEGGVVMLDSAYHQRLCNETEIRDAYERVRGWPGSARLQITLRLATVGAESVGESRMRYLFFRSGVPNPILQYAVTDGGAVVGITDFAWPEYGLLGEFDGRVKYGRLLRAGEDAGDAVFREKVREDRLRELTGWRMIRFTWADLSSPRQTADRVKRSMGLSW